ncbi:expressed unknown protein [Seminavis robusta]|uniref:Uncharacterized protein n=1 Tax=Seminavis robusta TaxID=568900 RepID=A0A9N8F0E2_9STRA|nr:expressed unknown protein [Seminavis robusta]|eukprot:Sro2853_g338640.1 n/a (98) ;mRNA; f:1589-1882
MVEMSHSQQVALAVIPKVAAGLSIVGSLFVMSDILSERFFRQRNNKKLSPYQRLLFGMSTFDLMMSTGLFVGTWAMPAEAPVYGSMGTIQTCEVEGF